MRGFEPVTLTWKGESYTVPAERQMRLIAEIEDALSGGGGGQAITILMRREGPPYSRLAAAFGAALRYAGAGVSDDEIYLSIMGSMADGRAEVVVQTQAAVMALLSIICPPLGKKLAEGDEPLEKSTPAAKD